ncbi:MAG: trypsin-like peptidase domain-containing protein, partial [Bacteroidota bacterium]
MKRMGLFIVACLALNATLTLFLFSGLKSNLAEELAAQQPPQSQVQFANYRPETNARPVSTFNVPENFVATAQIVMPAVVNITVKDRGGYDNVSGGSGVIISTDGYIITNNHVVEGGGKVEVTLNNKRVYQATFIGSDPLTDLALLKINGSGFSAIRYADSDQVQVGEWVMAVGNPFNLASTVTAGIVSAKGRNINILRGLYSIESFIQTDAVVNPGNSGGALVNMDGELVGINSAIMSESGSYEGYSFAIPANLVKKIIRDLKEHGSVQRAILGVNIREVNDEIADDLGLPEVEGIFVSEVTPNSSAEGAGL